MSEYSICNDAGDCVVFTIRPDGSGGFVFDVWVDCETGHFVADIVTNAGTYQHMDVAAQAAISYAWSWFSANDCAPAPEDWDVQVRAIRNDLNWSTWVAAAENHAASMRLVKAFCGFTEDE